MVFASSLDFPDLLVSSATLVNMSVLLSEVRDERNPLRSLARVRLHRGGSGRIDLSEENNTLWEERGSTSLSVQLYFGWQGCPALRASSSKDRGLISPEFCLYFVLQRSRLTLDDVNHLVDLGVRVCHGNQL